MEEESPDITDCIHQQPPQESWTSINLLNGQQEASADGADAGGVSLKAGGESPEEAEQWEQLVWPAHPVSCATVQWDVPTAAETPEVVADPDRTPSSALQRQAEQLGEEWRAQHDGFDSQPLDWDLHWTGNYTELAFDGPCCNFQPCDAAEPVIQEEEESTQRNNEVRSRTSSEGEDQTQDSINRGCESEDESLVDLQAEEEQDEPGALLTEQLPPEEEQTSTGSHDWEDQDVEGDGDDEQSSLSGCEETEEDNTVDRLTEVESQAELQRADDIRLTSNPVETLHSELLWNKLCLDTDKDLKRHADRTEMCVCQTVDPDQSTVGDSSDEASTHEAGNEEKIEGSHQVFQEVKDLVDVDCLVNSEVRDSSSSASSSLYKSYQGDMTEDLEQVSAALPQDGKEPADGNLTYHSAHLQPAESDNTERAICVEAAASVQTEPVERGEPEQTACGEQLPQAEKTDESEVREQLSHEVEASPQTEELNRVDQQQETLDRATDLQGTRSRDAATVLANGESLHMNGGELDRDEARQLAQRLFALDRIQRADVVKHLDKDNDFSRAVGEEYLQFFDFTGQNLDRALRSFLKVVILIGETQERERVLQHFSRRFHRCNPDSFSSSGAVLALTCALMLLNTDLHGQHVGKSMSCSKFVSNLDGMKDGGNFSKDLLKTLYNSIKSEPLQWAVDEEEVKSALLPEEDAGSEAALRSKANPFQDVPHDKKAAVVKRGFLQRKLHADVDGKRTPWGKRSWKTFYCVLKGMVLYLLKDDYRKETQTYEEVVSVHHSLAEPATDYTKKPYVFRLQTADWRVFLFQVSSKLEMNSWISRINLISALHSSPPFPAAIGSQRRFCRPILPASQSSHTLDRQLQFHTRMLESFKEDLSSLKNDLPEGRKAKTKDLEERRTRAEYLHYEVCRYEIYLQVLEGWCDVQKTSDGALNSATLQSFDRTLCGDPLGEDEELEQSGMKRSHSSPSLEAETATPQPVKVRRNISERRTYRRIVVPRRNKEV